MMGTAASTLENKIQPTYIYHTVFHIYSVYVIHRVASFSTRVDPLENDPTNPGEVELLVDVK
jgi:hypothetical protein